MGNTVPKRDPKRAARAVRRWRRSRRCLILAIVLLVALLAFADHRGWLLVPRGDDMTKYHGIETRVLRVIGGDTFEINVPDDANHRPATRITLWGVDCPEPAAAGREAEPFAQEAVELMRSLIEDRSVRLRLEPQRTRDAFGRLIAHVERLDAKSVNEALLEAGLAKVDERWPHALLLRYAQIEVNARRRRRGMWSGSAKRHD